MDHKISYTTVTKYEVLKPNIPLRTISHFPQIEKTPFDPQHSMDCVKNPHPFKKISSENTTPVVNVAL